MKTVKAKKPNEKLAEDIIYKSFNEREGTTCDHCERQYDDSTCEPCFRTRLYEKVKAALDTKDAQLAHLREIVGKKDEALQRVKMNAIQLNANASFATERWLEILADTQLTIINEALAYGEESPTTPKENK